MNIKLMKYFDELFGPLACLIFDIYNSINKLFVKPRLLPVNKILLIKLFGMGSIIMMGPMVRALRNKFPDAKITILTFRSNEEICELTKLFDKVVTISTDSIPKVMLSIFKKILILRRERFDVAIDLEFFSKSSTIISYLTGSRNRVGFFLLHLGTFLKMMWRGNLLTHEVFYNHHRHVTVAFLALGNAIGADTKDLGYAPIYIPKDACETVEDILMKNRIKDSNLIIVNINAGQLCLERRWPIENYAEVCKRLLDKGSTVIVLIGDKNDVEYVAGFHKMFGYDKRVINLVGKLNIGELAALLKRCRLFVTNDSGPLHIAVSLGIPTVSFFGPEIAERYGPLNGNHTVFYSGVYCSPCLNVFNQKTAPCNGNNICMRKISVEDVYKVIVEKYLKPEEERMRRAIGLSIVQ